MAIPARLSLMKLTLAFVFALTFSNAAWSQGTTSLAFGRSDQPEGLLSTYQDQGFTFFSADAISLFFVRPALFPEFGWHWAVVLTNNNGAAFNLASANWNNFISGDTLGLTGLRSDGSTISAIVSLLAGTQDLTSLGLTDLKSLTLGGRSLPLDSGTLAINAIMLTSIPEPSAIALVGAGILILFLVWRRRASEP